MLRRLVAILVLITFLSACYSETQMRVPVADFKDDNDRLVGVTLKDGEQIRFDRPGLHIDGVIYGETNWQPVQFPTRDVERVWLEQREFRSGHTALFVITVVVPLAFLAGGLIALALKESCPFVYSWDGKNWRFDGEPYGGAITKALERDDYSRLEHLRPDNGEYRLLVRNEVPETQHTNRMELLIVDHAPGLRVIPDATGHFATVENATPPLAAVDQHGHDLLPQLEATDYNIWEPPPMRPGELTMRHELTLTFPRPANTDSVNLITHIGTGLWGSHMIRELLSLRGRELDDWYEQVDNDPKYEFDLHRWGAQEELYVLQVQVEVDGQWRPRGLLFGGGPFMTEDRVLPLDISDVTGEEIRIRLRPPGGFWAMNSFALDASPDIEIPVQRVAAKAARSDDGVDLVASLAADDDLYYVQPEIGDQAEVTFDVPAQAEGTERSIFLASRGWYRLHLESEGEPDRANLQRVETVPDGAARLAAELYAVRPTDHAELQR